MGRKEVDPLFRRTVHVGLYLSPTTILRIERYRKACPPHPVTKNIPSRSSFIQDMILDWLNEKEKSR